ncbi:MAG: hypothetical protein RAO92_01170 [Candidatus Euphemobacter frigidus]|nr:hypothetical protein [Candidatus Euphemobacter frigidus]MDP8274990.1 hypothetical protein [Candidatus Euphemobacter frigidus]
MNEKGFTPESAIRYGWETMKKNLGFFIGVLLLAGFTVIIPNIISKLTEESMPVFSTCFSVLGGIFQIIVSMGLIRISLNFVDNVESRAGDLFSCIPLLLKYFIASLIYGIIVGFGLILFIVPGIIWAIKFQFYSYFIVDKGSGPIEALKQSSAITRGVKGDLFVLGLLLFLINLLGALCLLIGLFATIPTAMVALAFVFRTLQAMTGSDQETDETAAVGNT